MSQRVFNRLDGIDMTTLSPGLVKAGSFVEEKKPWKI